MKDPLGLIRIIRPVNSIMVGFAILVGVIIGGGREMLESYLILTYAFLTGFLLSGSSMAINDYYDRDIDAINEPKRVIPSGSLEPNEALIWSIILAILGLLAAYLTSWIHLGLAFLAWGASIFYATKGKKTGLPGNVIVSACVSLPFVYGGLLVGDTAFFSSLIFTFIAFLTNTGREITKGIVDIEGDKAEGINTIVVMHGSEKAAISSIILYLTAVGFSALPIIWEIVTFWYIPFILITDIGLVYASYSLFRNHSRDNSRKIKNIVRILMIIGLFGFLVGSIFG